ncbi:hypothetical protein, partial [Variovorax sp. YR752]|uniref:hypothetical protein n=1 Tax=Variovorax sp. YR752 TaxID=1884383 RepID=UPI003137CE97
MTRSVEPAGGLAEALRLLDTVLGAAVDRLARRLGPATLLDPWRGMHLERADVELLLAATHHPEFGVDGVAGLLGGAARMVPRLQRVAAEQGLADVDLALLLIALAPDVDLKYEKVYGYLQDDLTRKRPTPDLAANMLACDAEQRLQVLSRMDATSPLMRARTLVLRGSAEQSWIAHAIGLDGPWLNWLLGRELVDPARDDWCLLRQPGGVELDELGLDPDLRARLQPMLCRAGCGPQIL